MAASISQSLDRDYVPTPVGSDTMNSVALIRPVDLDADCKPASAETITEDVLATIFVDLASLSTKLLPPHPAIVVSHVCRQWRAVALGTPALWSDISILIPLHSLWCCVTGPTLPPAYATPAEAHAYYSICTSYINRVNQRARAFFERTSGRPITLLIRACDIKHAIRALPPLSQWNCLEPLYDLVHQMMPRVKNLTLLIEAFRDPAMASRFLGAISSQLGEGILTAEINLTTYVPIAGIPGVFRGMPSPGVLVNLFDAELSAFTLMAGYDHMRRARIPWASLTQFRFGAPSDSVTFTPESAYYILRACPKLVECDIRLSIHPDYPPRPFPTLTLANLKSLSVTGDMPGREFADALHLPSLTDLAMADCSGNPQGESTSALYSFIQRYGQQLRIASFAHSLLTQHALISALTLLPNVTGLILSSVTVPAIFTLFQMAFESNFDEASVLRALDPDRPRGCLCPKLNTLVCALRIGDFLGTEKAIQDLLDKRRGPSRNPNVSRLRRIEFTFSISPRESFIQRMIGQGAKREAMFRGGCRLQFKFGS